MTSPTYKTTSGRGADAAPCPPAGEGWELVGTSAYVDKGEVVQLWNWKLLRPTSARPCQTPQCGAVARKDGKCLGCGEAVPASN